MTREQLFDSLQYLDDELIAVGEERTSQTRVWRRWGSLAACLVLLAGAAIFAVRGPKGGTCTMPASGEQEAAAQTERPIQPGGVPGPAAEADAPAPASLAWIDVDSAAAEKGTVRR